MGRLSQTQKTAQKAKAIAKAEAEVAAKAEAAKEAEVKAQAEKALVREPCVRTTVSTNMGEEEPNAPVFVAAAKKERAKNVQCYGCNAEGRRFKYEGAWMQNSEVDADGESTGYWRHLCPECVMTRVRLDTPGAAAAYIYP